MWESCLGRNLSTGVDVKPISGMGVVRCVGLNVLKGKNLGGVWL